MGIARLPHQSPAGAAVAMASEDEAALYRLGPRAQARELPRAGVEADGARGLEIWKTILDCRIARLQYLRAKDQPYADTAAALARHVSPAPRNHRLRPVADLADSCMAAENRSSARADGVTPKFPFR